MAPNLKEKIMESLAAVLPITGIVLALSILLVPLTTGAVMMFFMGAVLSGELDRLIGMGAGRYVICGKRQLREPTAELLRWLCDAEVITVTDEQAEQATCRGAIKIYEY